MKNNSGKFKTLGVLGGLGPQATVLFYSKLISYSEKHFKGFASELYPPIIIYNCNFIPMLSMENYNQVNPKLVKAAQTLEKAGAKVIAIPSNFPHVFYDQIQSSVKIPVINLTKEIAKVLKKEGVKRVGIMETNLAHKSYLYEQVFDDAGIDWVCNDENCQKVQDASIHYMSGTLSKKDAQNVFGISDKLKKEGVDRILLACTEMPLILRDKLKKDFHVDPLDILVLASIREITI